jgi:hypothetical protein
LVGLNHFTVPLAIAALQLKLGAIHYLKYEYQQ